MLKKIDQSLDFLCSHSRFNKVVYLGRSFLAISLILTLLFNSTETLFSIKLQELNKTLSVLNFFSFFHHFVGHIFTKVIAVLILMLVVVGWRPRIMCLPHFWLIKSFTISCSVVEGGDQLHANLALLFTPVCLFEGAKWVFGSRNLPMKKSVLEQMHNVLTWFSMHLLRLQVAGMYLNAAVGKLPSEEWANGNAVYYWFWHPYLGASDFIKSLIGPLFKNDLFILLVNHGALGLEIILFASFIGNKQARKVLFVLGLLFHAGIFFVHGLFSFMITMFGALLILECYDCEEELSQLSLNLREKFAKFKI